LARLSARARKRLAIEICDFSLGTPPARVMELMAPLKRLCASVIARLPVETTGMAALREAGVTAVCCDVTQCAAPPLTLASRLGQFQRAAASAGLPAFARGVSSLDQLDAAIDAGLALIDGDAVAEDVSAPTASTRLERVDIYRRMQLAGG
jgi:hypothetical protein